MSDNGVEEQVAEYERVRALLNELPALEVEDPDEGSIVAGGAAIATVYMADDFPCLDETDSEKAQGEMFAIRDLIVVSVNLLPLLLADWRKMREDAARLDWLRREEGLSLQYPEGDGLRAEQRESLENFRIAIDSDRFSEAHRG